MTEEIKTEETPEEETPKEETEEETPEEEEEETKSEEEEETSEEEEDEKPSEEESDKTPRTPRLMEAWKHNVAEKNWGKEKAKLETTVADLQTQLTHKDSPERDKAIKSLIEKSGLDPEVVDELVKIAEMGQISLKKELDALKGDIKTTTEKSVWAEEDRKFEDDYERNIEPIIKADGIPEENLPRLKKLLKKLAFTEEYAKSPLPVVYRGVEDFKQFLPGTKKKSAESSKSGIRGEETEKSILDMNNEEYDAFVKGQTGRSDIRRDGESIKD